MIFPTYGLAEYTVFVCGGGEGGREGGRTGRIETEQEYGHHLPILFKTPFLPSLPSSSLPPSFPVGQQRLWVEKASLEGGREGRLLLFLPLLTPRAVENWWGVEYRSMVGRKGGREGGKEGGRERGRRDLQLNCKKVDRRSHFFVHPDMFSHRPSLPPSLPPSLLQACTSSSSTHPSFAPSLPAT